MALTVEQIRSAGSDEELLELLGGELRQLFPPELRSDPVVFLSRLHAAPSGLRAMATTYELDVSMAVDDLAWHFVNFHSSPELAAETIAGLLELEATEAAEIFREALTIIKPHWPELESVSQSKTAHEWLEKKGIQDLMNPLNDRMWKLFRQFGESGLMSVWAAHARKHPERCVVSAE
jgi:hypothetical protein